LHQLEVSRMQGRHAVARLPDLSNVKALVGEPWVSVEAQSGKLRHQSAQNPRAWSTSSLLIHGAIDVLAFVETYDDHGIERFNLRFARASDEWCSQHLKSARPSFEPILSWPPSAAIPAPFPITGPTDVEIGLGSPIRSTDTMQEGEVVPVLWCCFRAGESGLMLYADSEIPLNVGVVEAGAGLNIRNSLKAVSVAKF